MQSQSSSKKKKQARPRLPWGLGSAALKGKVFWITYRTLEGKVVYENSGTADAVEAKRIMATRALPRAKAVVAELEAIANEAATDGQLPDNSDGGAPGQTRKGKGSKRARSGAIPTVGAAPDAPAGTAGSKGNRGGQA